MDPEALRHKVLQPVPRRVHCGNISRPDGNATVHQGRGGIPVRHALCLPANPIRPRRAWRREHENGVVGPTGRAGRSGDAPLTSAEMLKGRSKGTPVSASAGGSSVMAPCSCSSEGGIGAAHAPAARNNSTQEGPIARCTSEPKNRTRGDDTAAPLVSIWQSAGLARGQGAPLPASGRARASSGGLFVTTSAVAARPACAATGRDSSCCLPGGRQSRSAQHSLSEC